MLDLCDSIQRVGRVRSMLGPSWVFFERLDWVSAVMVRAQHAHLFNPLFATHVSGARALLEVHTSFPSMGAGGTGWVLEARKALKAWEAAHPGFSVSMSLILLVMVFTFRSLLMPLRLALALVVTLSA